MSFLYLYENIYIYIYIYIKIQLETVLRLHVNSFSIVNLVNLIDLSLGSNHTCTGGHF